MCWSLHNNNISNKQWDNLVVLVVPPPNRYPLFLERWGHHGSRRPRVQWAETAQYIPTRVQIVILCAIWFPHANLLTSPHYFEYLLPSNKISLFRFIVVDITTSICINGDLFYVTENPTINHSGKLALFFQRRRTIA